MPGHTGRERVRVWNREIANVWLSADQKVFQITFTLVDVLVSGNDDGTATLHLCLFPFVFSDTSEAVGPPARCKRMARILMAGRRGPRISYMKQDGKWDGGSLHRAAYAINSTNAY